jgi:hypothetical protein
LPHELAHIIFREFGHCSKATGFTQPVHDEVR